jgi:hypothetical protein
MGRQRNTDYQARSSHIASKCGKDGKWKLYIIAAEGDKTEYKYFNELIIKYKEDFGLSNIHVEFIDREIGGNSDPKYVHETLVKFYEELEKYRDLKEHDELWIIIDIDDYDKPTHREKISQIEKKCRENPIYKLCTSNPCFEIWLILHFVDLNTALQDCVLGQTSTESLNDYILKHPIRKRPGICKRELLPRIHQDKHQPYYEKLIEYVPQAISRAKMLGECNLNNPDYPERKIGTEVYKLLEKLTQISMDIEI